LDIRPAELGKWGGVMKVLGVDPGEKRIGVAVSDPSGTISRPLRVVEHLARGKDAQLIAEIALDEAVDLIVVGQPLDANGEVGPQARKSIRLADAIRAVTETPVHLWDESGTTQAAIRSRVALGVSRKKRKGHLDDLAASILLQDFLIQNEDWVRGEETTHG
jgi:putative Holliday junction resolvase